MKNKGLWIGLIILTLIFAAFWCALGVASLHLLPAPPDLSALPDLASEPTYTSDDLFAMLIRLEDLPAEPKQVTGPYYYLPDFKRNYTDGVNVQFTGGLVPNDWTYSHNIYQFGSEFTAQDDYASALSRLVGFSAPAAEALPPLRADEFNLVCTEIASRTSPYCIWTARYDTLVVELMAWLEPEHLSFEDLQAMIGVLDERISGIIQDGGTRPWGQDF